MKEQKHEEVLKVKEYLGIVIEIKSEDNAKTQREAIAQLFKVDGVTGIIYQRRTADKLIVLPERELEKYGIKIKVRR